MGKLSIVELGQPMEVDVVRYYKKNDTNYFMYTKNEIDDQGYVKLYAAKISEENGILKTTDITNPTEWNDVKNTMKQIVRDNRELSPVSVEDLNVATLKGLELTERHVFKLAENIVSYLSANQKQFEDETKDNFSLEQLVEETPEAPTTFDQVVSEEPQNQVETPVEESNPFQMFTPAPEETPKENVSFDQPYEPASMEPAVATPVEEPQPMIEEAKLNIGDKEAIEELDLSGINLKNSQDNITTDESLLAPKTETDDSVFSTSENFTLPQEELKDVTLMNVGEENNNATSSWENFEMPVTPVSETTVEESTGDAVVTSTEKAEEHKGFFGNLFGKKHQEKKEEESVIEPTSNKEEAKKLFASLERNEVQLPVESVTTESEVMIPEESTKEDSIVLPTVEPTDEEPLQPISVDSVVQEEPKVEEAQPFNFNGFDPLNESPSYEVPSFDSLGLNDNRETSVTIEPAATQQESSTEVQPDLTEANYQTLYFDEKRKAEDLAEKVESLQMEVDQLKKKLEEVKNIIL